jgi:hypothetical protein
MRPLSLRRTFLNIVAIALLVSSATFGQSLGDVARENREKQNVGDAASGAKPKVITNKDLPKDPDADLTPNAAPAASAASTPTSAAASSKTAESRAAERHFALQRAAEQRAAEQWTKQILAQKTKMANMQARIDQLQASIRSANGSVQAEQPFNRYQARQLQQVARMQQQLSEQKIRLDQMQDAARHAGMHTAVYDP